MRKSISDRTSGNATPRLHGYAVDVHADPVDFRDRMYVPTLVEVATHLPMERYLEHRVPVLDQGREGACTGFALATVAHYLLRTRRVVPDTTPVSPHMLYRMARQHDEWPGEKYSGSSARGAMKGWHKYGVCSATAWPARPRRGEPPGLNKERTADAIVRPLGAYFRVNHRDLVAMHAALAEVGILFATAIVHAGWGDVEEDGAIPWREGTSGGHAFAIVAYDRGGFWLQNSWGPSWGRQGFGYISYDDWMANATDVWVARLGVPVQLQRTETYAMATAAVAAGASRSMQSRLRQHVISVDNDGRLQPGGDFGMEEADLERFFSQEMSTTFGKWKHQRVLIYAHGGLVGEAAAVQRVSEYLSPLLQAEVYPLAFIWHSDYWSTLGHILEDAIRRRRSEGALDAAKDFLLDRVDDALEPLARAVSGRASWREMKENAAGASLNGHAADLVVRQLRRIAEQWPGLEIHLVAHSAGSVLHGALLQVLSKAGLHAQTCTLWAPACTMALFEQQYVPALQAGTLKRMAVYALDDRSEQDDHCARIYNKSLLYLVAHAFEDRQRVPWLRPHGTPLLGMQKFHAANIALQAEVQAGRLQIVTAPNSLPQDDLGASQARTHSDFDDDPNTVRSSFARIFQKDALLVVQPMVTEADGPRSKVVGEVSEEATPAFCFRRSATSLQTQREALDAAR
jgi:hypothetical protein